MPGCDQLSITQSRFSTTLVKFIEAAANRIMNDMTAGADPVGADRVSQPFGQALHVDQAAPRDDAGERRVALAEQYVAHGRVHAVGADRDVTSDRRLIVEVQLTLEPSCSIALK